MSLPASHLLNSLTNTVRPAFFTALDKVQTLYHQVSSGVLAELPLQVREELRVLLQHNNSRNSNPVGVSEFVLGFICDCLSYFTTVKISFISILYPQFTHMIFIIYTPRNSRNLLLLLPKNTSVRKKKRKERKRKEKKGKGREGKGKEGKEKKRKEKKE